MQTENFVMGEIGTLSAALVDKLPVEAKQILDRMVNEKEIGEARRLIYRDKLDRARADLKEAEDYYRGLTYEPVGKRLGMAMVYSEKHPIAVAAFEKIEPKKFLANRAREQFEAVAPIPSAINHSIERLGAYLKTARGQLAGIKPPKIDSANEKTSAKIQATREKVESLKAEIQAIQSRPFTLIEAKARMRAEVEALALMGTPSTESIAIHGPGEGIGWPNVPFFKASGQRVFPMNDSWHGYATDEIPGDGIAVMAWLFKDIMMARLEAQIDEAGTSHGAISIEERKNKIAELNAKKLEAERSESALIAALNWSVPHREDIDIRAVFSFDGPSVIDTP